MSLQTWLKASRLVRLTELAPMRPNSVDFSRIDLKFCMHVVGQIMLGMDKTRTFPDSYFV